MPDQLVVPLIVRGKQASVYVLDGASIYGNHSGREQAETWGRALSLAWVRQLAKLAPGLSSLCVVGLLDIRQSLPHFHKAPQCQMLAKKSVQSRKF